MALDVAAFKQTQRKIWSSGDYPDVARLIESAAEHLVRAADVQAGQDVLDVATGSGNVALLAAQRGANVTGLDITPELFEAARRRAAEAGVDIEWVEGDAEELPYEDDSFDRVLSAFGTMFAPRHERAAAELVRVTKPGGIVAVAAWTPEGTNGQMFRTVASHMPPPPARVEAAGDVGRRGAHPLAVRAARRRARVRARAASTSRTTRSTPWLAYGEEKLGPMVMARAALEPQGKWDALRADLEALYERENMNTDGSFRVEPEYLVTIARVPGSSR